VLIQSRVLPTFSGNAVVVFDEEAGRSSAKADGWLSGNHDCFPQDHGHAPSRSVVR
jgi:hypothetical protein